MGIFFKMFLYSFLNGNEYTSKGNNSFVQVFVYHITVGLLL